MSKVVKHTCNCYTNAGTMCKLPASKKKGDNPMYCSRFHQDCSRTEASAPKKIAKKSNKPAKIVKTRPAPVKRTKIQPTRRVKPKIQPKVQQKVEQKVQHTEIKVPQKIEKVAPPVTLPNVKYQTNEQAKMRMARLKWIDSLYEKQPKSAYNN